MDADAPGGQIERMETAHEVSRAVSDGIPPRSDGKSTRVAWFHGVVPHYRVAVINALAQTDGIALTVFAGQGRVGYSHGDASPDVRAPVLRLTNIYGSRRRLPFAYAHGWSKVLRGFDVVITSESTRDLVTWLLLSLRRLFGFKLVIMGHIRITPHDAKHVARLRRLLARSADGVIAYTDDGVRQALAWGVDADSVTAVGNTMDIERVKQARQHVLPERLDAVRRDLGLEGPVFLFIARPSPWKRLDIAIEAMRILKDRGLMAHLLVVGSGPNLARYVVQAHGVPSVNFIGEVTDEDALAVYFAASDLVLIPGAVGLAVNHAFAYGLPLMTSRDVQHGPEMALAQHGRNALLIDACEAPQFADALESLIRSPERLAQLALGARATEVPTIAAMSSKIATLVRHVGMRK
jgi:glycosyltransferase involved in cell wall biosynthesis